jgi:hypothetical protein
MARALSVSEEYPWRSNVKNPHTHTEFFRVLIEKNFVNWIIKFEGGTFQIE